MTDARIEMIPPEYVPDLSPIEVTLNIQLHDAAHKRQEAVKDNEAHRKAQRRDHIYGLARNAAVSLVSIVIVLCALIYTGFLIANPNTSAESKQLAFGLWGLILGAASTFLFSEGKSLFKGGKE